MADDLISEFEAQLASSKRARGAAEPMRSVPIKRQSPAALAGAGAEKLTANASESAQEPPRRRLVKNATFSDDDDDDVGDNDNDRDAEVSDDNDDDDAPLSKRAKGRSPPARKPAATA